MRRLRRGPTACGGSRNSSSMRDAACGLRAFGFSACSTRSGTITVRAQYEILSRWNGNQRGSSMISTGITGTARHGTTPKSASSTRVKTLRSSPRRRAQDRLARAPHVRRVDGVADHLEREIGLHARAHVEGAVVEQRPAAMRALDAAQIDARSCAPARCRPARRDSGAAARIRPEWWRRLRARTPNGRPALLRGEQRAASPRRCSPRSSRVQTCGADDVCRRHRSSSLRSCAASRQIGCAVARADRAFDGRGQPGVGPIAGEEQIAPCGVRPPGAWRSAPASPRKSRAARARSARAAAAVRSPATVRDLAPDGPRQAPRAARRSADRRR